MQSKNIVLSMKILTLIKNKRKTGIGNNGFTNISKMLFFGFMR